MKVWTLEEIDMLERSAFEAGEFVATERIIKLLKEQTCVYGEHCADGPCSFHEILNYAIALIEEEK